MKILVTGSGGQVGSEFKSLSTLHPEMEFVFVDKSEMNITDQKNVDQIFARLKPDWCINCAAYTLVDKAEEEKEMAYAINAKAVSYIAAACEANNCALLHYSSDYVYDNNCSTPMKESEPTIPKSIYAKSKLEGEKLALEYCHNSIIIRTSWVYSSFGNNFVKTMLRLGKAKEELTIVSDQIGSPTYARDLAQASLAIIIFLKGEKISSYSGIYNYSNSGITDWQSFADKIFELEKIACVTNSTSTEDYGALAARPLYSVLSKQKIIETFGIKTNNWEESLKDCLEVIASQPA